MRYHHPHFLSSDDFCIRLALAQDHHQNSASQRYDTFKSNVVQSDGETVKLVVCVMSFFPWKTPNFSNEFATALRGTSAHSLGNHDTKPFPSVFSHYPYNSLMKTGTSTNQVLKMKKSDFFFV